MKKLSFSLISFIFLVQTLILPVSLAGGVLCVSESHIAFEFHQSIDDCHHETMVLNNLLKNNHEYHQDFCRDIPLLQHEKNLHVKQIKIVKSFISFNIEPTKLNHFTSNFKVSRLLAYTPSQSLALVQSVVLLI